MRAQISNRDYEQISAYIDGQLAPGERRKLEERMNARPDLKKAFEELEQTRALIRMTPRRRAPRNFTLTPAMVEGMRSSRRQGLLFNLFPALSFASALATLVLVATLALDLAPGLRPGGIAVNQPEIAALQAPVEESNSAQADLPAQKQAAPEEGTGRAMEAAPAQAAPPAAEAVQTEQVERIAEAPAAQGEAQVQPPIITWNDPNAPQVDTSVMGKGGGGGGYAPLPSMGMGGGDSSSYNGESGMTAGGALILPLEAAKPDASAQAAPAAQTTPAITGGGPVLGLPPAEEEGQIEIRSAFGEPLVISDTPAAPEPGPAAEPGVQTAREGVPSSGRPGWSAYRTVQVLLALLAAVTGAAALWVRKSRV